MVKQLKDSGAVGGEREFQIEVEMISLAVHHNLPLGNFEKQVSYQLCMFVSVYLKYICHSFWPFV